MVNRPNPLLVIVGATAVGKTDLSIQLAEQFQGEIISVDSRLFYKGMDIGTAKPDREARTRVAHHLIDICHPNETITLGQFQDMAYATINQVLQNGRLPILVGGTGQYIKAVVEGWGIPRVSPQPRLRQALKHLGGPECSRWLQTLDPKAAARIDARNVRRVIRALEVTLVTGRPISDLQRKSPPPYTICMVGLHRERSDLYARIDRRVEQMMGAGLLNEVKQLADQGYGRSLPAMSGLGYRQIYQHLAGELTHDEAIERIKFETHRFARQQHTWFRQDDPAINWFDATDPELRDLVTAFVIRWLNND